MRRGEGVVARASPNPWRRTNQKTPRKKNRRAQIQNKEAKREDK